MGIKCPKYHLDSYKRKFLSLNFVFFHTGKPIEEFQDAMEKQGILVGRPFSPYLDWCRLSMTKPEWMDKFAAAFQKVMG